MFDTALVASNRRREAGRKLATLPAALAIHAAALGFLMVGQLWAVQPVADRDALIVYVDGPPPPPPPPPPPKGGTGADAVKRVDVPPPDQPTQPREIPAQAARGGPEQPSGETGGVQGGVTGGKVEGVIGGVVTGRKEEVAPASESDVPVRPGEGIVLPVNVLRRDPVYPDLARRARLQGVVIVEATIDRHGDVVDATVLRDLGFGCGAAVVEAVKTWKYRPAMRDGRPVSVILTLTVTFRLAGIE